MNKFHEPNHELWNVSQLAIRLFHIEAFAKTQIAKDVENQICDLISHVNRLRPLVTLFLLLAKQLQPAVNITMDEDFSASQCALRERIVDHATLPGMHWNRRSTPRVDVVHCFGPDRIVLALLHVAFGAKDVSVRRWGIKADAVRRITVFRSYPVNLRHDQDSWAAARTVFLLQAEKPQVSILVLGVPPRRERGQFRPERSRKLCQRMEIQSVYCRGKDVCY